MSATAPPLVEHAERYSRLRWALIRANGKEPRDQEWQRAKPMEPGSAAGTWAHYGDRYNMGCVLGPSGLAIFEYDDETAYPTFLEMLGGQLPATPICRTGSGKLHVYFADPGGLDKKSRDGLELRVGNHQCLVPPSVHPETGKPYVWLEGREPWSVDLLPLPEAIAEHFRAARNGKGAEPVLGTIAAGGRHAALVSLAGTMRRRGMGAAEIFAALKVTNATRCKPPLTEAEIRTLADDVAERWEPAEPQTSSEPEPREEIDMAEVEAALAVTEGDRVTRVRAVDGATFVLGVPDKIPTIWGDDDGIAWAEDEGVMIAGPDGVGKTALAQQLALRRAGIRTGPLLGMDVKEAAGRVLYIAGDRPRQAASSLKRMVTEADEARLRGRLIVWKGPLEFNIDEKDKPAQLREFIDTFDGVSDIFIDSLKDVADDLSDNGVGTRVNRALQEVIASGYQLVPLHHQVKQQRGQPAPKKLSDVYGSRWITAGMGSVLLLWGDAGDLVVELRHLKQPEGEIGPFNVLHDHDRGTSTVHERADLLQALAVAPHGMTVADAASLLLEKSTPTKSEIEKARRRLNKLADSGRVTKHDDPDGLARYFDPLKVP